MQDPPNVKLAQVRVAETIDHLGRVRRREDVVVVEMDQDGAVGRESVGGVARSAHARQPVSAGLGDAVHVGDVGVLDLREVRRRLR